MCENQQDLGKGMIGGMMQDTEQQPVRRTRLDSLITKRNNLESQLKIVTEQIRLMKENPVISHYFDLDSTRNY